MQASATDQKGAGSVTLPDLAPYSVPNAFGRGRPLSARTPPLLPKDDSPFLVLGSPGGPRSISALEDTIMGVVDFHLNIQKAVNGPHLHHQWMPDKIYVQKDFSPAAIDLKTGDRLGASDIRNNGKAVGC